MLWIGSKQGPAGEHAELQERDAGQYADQADLRADHAPDDVEGDGVVDVFGGYPGFIEAQLRSRGGHVRVYLPLLCGELRALGFAELDGDETLDMVGLRDGRLFVRPAAP